MMLKMDQPSLKEKNNIPYSQEMQTARIAKLNAVEAMEEARSQVVRDMEDMRSNVKRVMDNKSIKDLYKKLLDVAKKGINNFMRHISMPNETTQRMVLEASQQMDARLHQEIGRRFVHGSETVTSSSTSVIFRFVTEDTKADGSIAVELYNEMEKTLTEFISVMLADIYIVSKANSELFKIWWNLHDQFDEAKNKGLAMYDELLQKSHCATPDIASKYRKELENDICYMQKDYMTYYTDLGMEFFANTMMTFCVASAGACPALIADGILVGVASSEAVRDGAARYIMQMGPTFPYIALPIDSLTLLALGWWKLALTWTFLMVYYFFGKKDKPEKIVERWQRYLPLKNN